MWIAVDAMGGDNAPVDQVAGAVRAVREHQLKVRLVGDEPTLQSELEKLEATDLDPGQLEVVHADEVVEMDESPITPIRKKKRSSVRVAAELVRDGKADALVSAGNTGAAMICAKMLIGVADGVDRPALATTVPTRIGHSVLLDVGANIDSKPSQLVQFAVMGALFCEAVIAKENPTIGVLSIGEEQGKGNDFVREVFDLLTQADVNFIGNVEGGDIFDGTSDVIVCDGFVGNVVLKSAESLAENITRMMREELERSPLTRLAAGLARPALLRFKNRIAYEEYGGAPLLGLKAGCFIAHGRANPTAMMNAVRRASDFCKAGVHREISRRLSEREAALLSLANA